MTAYHNDSNVVPNVDSPSLGACPLRAFVPHDSRRVEATCSPDYVHITPWRTSGRACRCIRSMHKGKSTQMLNTVEIMAKIVVTEASPRSAGSFGRGTCKRDMAGGGGFDGMS